MSFVADKQTLEDLNLTGKFKAHSVYSLFNKVYTSGGERLLEKTFSQPLTDAAAINRRSDLFRYFQQRTLSFPFRRESFKKVDDFLSAGSAGNIVVSVGSMLYRKLLYVLFRDERYQQLQSGLAATVSMLHELNNLLQTLDIEMVQPAKKILALPQLSWIKTQAGKEQFPLIQAAQYDALLRNNMNAEMELLLDTVYQLDVYIAVSSVARERKLSYAQVLPAADNKFRATAIWHPALDKAVPNSMELDADQNLLFLTGANMAGKSTFMKSFGIALYLGHIGFPVAARDMAFSVRDGLYSSINVPDNLNMGYSHFYAEVMRVKQAAAEVCSGKNMVVIFDELFKGTNVKDAYEATLTVAAAFSKYRNCLFIISTHIIEVGEALREYPNIRFAYLPTVMNNHIPTYTYQLAEGITEDRHGMMIIRNEKIVEMLKADAGL